MQKELGATMLPLASFTMYEMQVVGNATTIGWTVGLRTPTSIWTGSPTRNSTGVTFTQATSSDTLPWSGLDTGGAVTRFALSPQPARRSGIRAMAAPTRIKGRSTWEA